MKIFSEIGRLTFLIGMTCGIIVYSFIQVTIPNGPYIPGTCPITYLKFMSSPNCGGYSSFLSWDDLFFLFALLSSIGLFIWRVDKLGVKKGLVSFIFLIGTIGTIAIFLDVIAFTWIYEVILHIPYSMSPFPWWGERVSAGSCFVPMSTFSNDHPNCWLLNYGEAFLCFLVLAATGFFLGPGRLSSRE
jgi:hypothetical protein